jgi:hypothetical protein
VTFITYSSVGNELTPATIFPALQLFDNVAQSLRVMPLMLTNLLDARICMSELAISVTWQRLNLRTCESNVDRESLDPYEPYNALARSHLIQAEELESYLHIDTGMSSAIKIRGDFQYDSVDAGVEEAAKDDKAETEDKASSGGALARAKAFMRKRGEKSDGIEPAEKSPDVDEAAPFALRDIDLTIAKGERHVSR